MVQTTCRCDHCGQPIERNREAVVTIRVPPEEGLNVKPKTESFDFCAVCALNFAVAIKERRTQIRRHGHLLRA